MMNEPRYSGLDLHQIAALKQSVIPSVHVQKQGCLDKEKSVDFNPIKRSFV